METTTSDGNSNAFDQAAYEKIVRDVFTFTPYSESHPNNLAGSIHPIFSRGNWYVEPPTTYLQYSDTEEFFKVMDPVLRLASNLFQSPNSRLFLAYLFYADREHLVDLSNRLGREARQFNHIEGIDFSEVLARTTTLLDRLAGHISFSWYDPSNDAEGTSPFRLGFCKRRLRTLAYMSRSGRPTGYVSHISLNHELFFKLRQLRLNLHDSSSTNVDGIQSQILRLQFVIATTVCHEIVHACNNSINLREGVPEPFFEDERIAELGHSWESAVIGGTYSVPRDTVASNNGDLIAANPLLITKWPGFERRATRTVLERSLPLLYQNKFYISIDWIARIQQEDQWQSTDPGEISALLEIPRSLGFTEKYPYDDFDPDWKSKFVDELDYLAKDGPDLETEEPSTS